MKCTQTSWKIFALEIILVIPTVQSNVVNSQVLPISHAYNLPKSGRLLRSTTHSFLFSSLQHHSPPPLPPLPKAHCYISPTCSLYHNLFWSNSPTIQRCWSTLIMAYQQYTQELPYKYDISVLKHAPQPLEQILTSVQLVYISSLYTVLAVLIL